MKKIVGKISICAFKNGSVNVSNEITDFMDSPKTSGDVVAVLLCGAAQVLIDKYGASHDVQDKFADVARDMFQEMVESQEGESDE